MAKMELGASCLRQVKQRERRKSIVWAGTAGAPVIQGNRKERFDRFSKHSGLRSEKVGIGVSGACHLADHKSVEADKRSGESLGVGKVTDILMGELPEMCWFGLVFSSFVCLRPHQWISEENYFYCQLKLQPMCYLPPQNPANGVRDNHHNLPREDYRILNFLQFCWDLGISIINLGGFCHFVGIFKNLLL